MCVCASQKVLVFDYLKWFGLILLNLTQVGKNT